MEAVMRTALRAMALSLAAMVGLAAAAVAGEAWKADPPGHWRKLTWDEKTTTSKCIGKPISPICAVETKLAYLGCGTRAPTARGAAWT
jgi:hypothetical protein